MRSLQLVSRAILFLSAVLVSATSGNAFAISMRSGLLSGAATIDKLSLEEDFAVLASSPEPETASSENIAIRAVNPGYNTDVGKNAGELIELVNLTFFAGSSPGSEFDSSSESDSSPDPDSASELGSSSESNSSSEFSPPSEIDLSNVALIYTAKPTDSSPNGKSTILYQFPEGSRFIGRSILLRYKDSPEVDDGEQDLTYDTSLAMSGSLTLLRIGSDFPLSSLCWLGGEDCLPSFSTTVKSRSYTTILRDDKTGEYAHTNDYLLLYDPNDPGLYLPPASSDSQDDSSTSSSGLSDSASGRSTSGSGATNSSDIVSSAAPVCTGLEFSEILTYYADDESEQFIEIYNSTNHAIDLSQCQLRYKKKLYSLAVTVLAPSAYYVYHPAVKLTKNPTTENLFEIIDANGDVIDTLSLPHGQKKSTSYALIDHFADGTENWLITYNPTPGAPNVYQEFQTCPAGKVINPETGNCINAASLATTLKDCGEGKYRNPETGRCKSYSSSSSSDPTPCKEGYERNPETNRCRKIKENNGADYPVVPVTGTEERSSFIALWALGVVALLGLAYVIFQFRREIIYFFRKFLTKFKK